MAQPQSTVTTQFAHEIIVALSTLLQQTLKQINNDRVNDTFIIE